MHLPPTVSQVGSAGFRCNRGKTTGTVIARFRTPAIKQVTRPKYWCGRQSGWADTHSDVMVERIDDRVPGDFEPAAQIIPDRDAELVTRLGETEKSVTAI